MPSTNIRYFLKPPAKHITETTVICGGSQITGVSTGRGGAQSVSHNREEIGVNQIGKGASHIATIGKKGRQV